MQNRITFSNVIGVLLENKKKTYAQYRMIEDIFFDCLSNMDLFEKDDFEKNVEDIVTMVVTAVDSYDIIHGFYSNKDKAGIIILVVNVSFNLMPYSTEYAGEGIPVMEDNTYLITNGEKYDVYLFDQYIETVDDLMGYDGIPVYDNLEEVKK